MTDNRSRAKTEFLDSQKQQTDIAGLYLHIPFCGKRCNYCDFSSMAVRPNDSRIKDYVQALQVQLRRFMRAGYLSKLDSVYIGGGTPSYIQQNIVDLVYLISLSIDHIDDTEFNIEANPDSFNERLFRDLRALGVNRYSLGVQSLDDTVLHTLGRLHNAQAAIDAMSILDAEDANYSIDLMCGIPNQTMTSWQQTLDLALKHRFKHISIYPLSIEPGTAFELSIQQGSMPLPDEDAAADQMEYAASCLIDAGFVRYEVASYALPSYESRHNRGYWTGKQYLGLGSASASAVYKDTYVSLLQAGLIKSSGAKDCDSPRADTHEPYLYRLNTSDDPQAFISADTLEVSVERLSQYQAVCERVMLMMRLSKGISQAVLEAFALLVPGLIPVFESLIRDELVVFEEECYLPTKRGWLMGNLLFARIWGLADTI